MKNYILIYDPEVDRLAMYSDDERIHLHCGDCIEVQKIDITSSESEPWQSTRVEHGEDWYLVGLYKQGEIPIGLRVRK